MIEKLDLDKIRKTIVWYDSDSTKILDNLIRAAKSLANQSFYLADSLREPRSDYGINHFKRKVEFSRCVVRHSNQGDSIAKSEHLARLDVEKIQLKEVESQIVIDNGKMLLSTIDNVLQRMNQEIAEERAIQRKQEYAHKQ